MKVMEINDYLRENAYNLTIVEFLSLIGTTVDEYCAKNGLDVNETWEDLNAFSLRARREVIIHPSM